MLNEQVYDLKTVIDFKGIDPQRVKFEPSHVQPFRKAVTDFENGIRKINETRKAKLESENQNELVGAPGGPNFQRVAFSLVHIFCTNIIGIVKEMSKCSCN